MLSRDEELTEMRNLNLTVIAADHGFDLVERKSTRDSKLMIRGQERIIVTKKGSDYVFCIVDSLPQGKSVPGPIRSGSAIGGGTIEFVQKVLQPGCNLGEVRKVLRPYLNGVYFDSVVRNKSKSVATDMRESMLDLEGVAQRYKQLSVIERPNKFLTETRGIPHEVIMSDRLRCRIRFCPRKGSVAFGHLGSPTEDPNNRDRVLTGYEIKHTGLSHTGLSRFAKGGRKGLWMSAGFADDKRLVVGEAALDSISYLVARGDDGTRVCSTAGKLNPHQPALLRSAIQHLGEGEIVAAFDRDAAGDELTERLSQIAASHSRDSLVFKDDRPTAQGADWNQVIMEEAAREGRLASHEKKNGPAIGR